MAFNEVKDLERNYFLENDWTSNIHHQNFNEAIFIIIINVVIIVIVKGEDKF